MLERFPCIVAHIHSDKEVSRQWELVCNNLTAVPGFSSSVGDGTSRLDDANKLLCKVVANSVLRHQKQPDGNQRARTEADAEILPSIVDGSGAMGKETWQDVSAYCSGCIVRIVLDRVNQLPKWWRLGKVTDKLAKVLSLSAYEATAQQNSGTAWHDLVHARNLSGLTFAVEPICKLVFDVQVHLQRSFSVDQISTLLASDSDSVARKSCLASCTRAELLLGTAWSCRT